jgi:hypothetical protein
MLIELEKFVSYRIGFYRVEYEGVYEDLDSGDI